MTRNEERDRERETGREKLRLVSHGVLSTKFTHCHLGHGVNRRRKEREASAAEARGGSEEESLEWKGGERWWRKARGGREKGRRKKEKRENFREGWTGRERERVEGGSEWREWQRRRKGKTESLVDH